MFATQGARRVSKGTRLKGGSVVVGLLLLMSPVSLAGAAPFELTRDEDGRLVGPWEKRTTAPAATQPVTPRAPVAEPAPSTTNTGIWDPPAGITWQWQLTGTIDTSHDVDAYDIDGFDADAATVQKIKASGARVICYISAGSYEDWRPDASNFPAPVIGSSNGWEGENWIDIRSKAVLDVMDARMAMCAEKGFDAVEFDNIDGFSNSSGFPLTAQDQLNYSKALADAAHRHGLAAALKNNAEQAAQLEPYFDMVVVEQCYEYDECDQYQSFVAADKPVLITEYESTGFCADAKSKRYSAIKKDLDLGPAVEFC